MKNAEDFQQYMLMAYLEGRFTSYFTKHTIKNNNKNSAENFRKVTTQGQLVVTGDSDFLSAGQNWLIRTQVRNH